MAAAGKGSYGKFPGPERIGHGLAGGPDGSGGVGAEVLQPNPSSSQEELQGMVSGVKRNEKAQVPCNWRVPFFVICLLLGALVALVLVFMKRKPSDLPVLVPKAPLLHVLVTGGAGYIGSHTALALLEAGHVVTIIDNLSRGNLGAIRVLRSLARPRHLRFVWGDLANTALVEEALTSPKVDLVFHFAAVTYPAESLANPIRYHVNVSANTYFLLQAMQSAGVDKLVFSSSCAVYGNTSDVPVTERSPLLPLTPYAQAKVAAEAAIRDVARSRSDFRAVVLRFFNVYGADPQGRLGEFVPPAKDPHFPRSSSVCFDTALGRLSEFPVLGTALSTPDGTAVRDYIHVADLVKALLLAMPVVANPPRLYNVGTGRGVSIKEFVQACEKATQRKIKIREQLRGRPGDPEMAWADNSKIKKELNWTPSYTNLEAGLATAWRWRKAHPEGYTNKDATAAGRAALLSADR